MSKKRKKSINSQASQMAHSFYMRVYSYINMEYKPKYAKIFADSEDSTRIVDLVNTYFWGGNTIQFTAGQIVDLIKSKYK
jgi:hypothetical protein